MTTILLFSSSFFLNLYAQQTDSVISNYNNFKEDEKLEAIVNFVNTNKNIYPEKSLIYADDGLNIAKNSQNSDLIIKFEMLVANCLKIQGEYKQSLQHLTKALEITKKEKNNKLIATISIALGDVYGLISKYNDALTLNLDALKINKDLNDKKGIAESYHNISIVYYYILNFEKAREYNFLSLKLFRELKDTAGIAKSLSNIALIYANIDSLEKALDYNLSALEMFKKTGNTEGLANAYTNLGITHIYMQNYDEALKYLNMALEIFNGKFNNRNRFLVLANIANAQLQKKNFPEALKVAQEGYQLAVHSQSPDLLAIIFNLFSQIYHQTNDFENAFKYEKAFTAIRDSIFNEESRNKISELEVRIETENKTLENELLRKTNRLQMIFIIVSSILVIIIVIILYNRYKTKKHANLLLEEKNKLITEQNQSLEQLNHELNEANVAKDKFFSIMAHDLKSPLWWFKNVTELLSNKFDELSKEKIMEITKVLDDSAQTSLHLIENLLQWSRSQSGTIEFITEKINLSHVFKHILAHHRLHAEEKKINLVINIPENAEMIADKNMLYSILRNIISNAIKFSNSGGTITIDFFDEKDNWKLSVADTGIGIKNEDIEKIFRIDIRTTTLGTAQEKGTGLGLILTKEFIERHGGKLIIESQPNVGTKFVFTIPKK